MQRQGFGIRLGALLIDVVIIIVGMLFIGLVFGFGMFTAGATRGAAAEVSMVAVLLAALWPLVYSSTEIFMAASPGKKLLGMTIANPDGSPAMPPALATRWAIKQSSNLLNLLAALTTVVLFKHIGSLAGLAVFIGCFLTLRADRLALHDIIAKTAVFKKPAGQ